MPNEPDELTIKVARAISRAWMSNGEDWVHFVDEARAAISVCVEHFAGALKDQVLAAPEDGEYDDHDSACLWAADFIRSLIGEKQ